MKGLRLASHVLVSAAMVGTALLLLSFALPVPEWRTGEQAAPALEYRGDVLPLLRLGERIWIDTDAACGTGPYRDPDDCVALLALLRRHRGRIAGISTVFGNAPIEVTDATTRSVVDALGVREAVDPVWRGCGDALDACVRDGAHPPPALDAIASVLRERRPLTFVALGPLTNLAAVLRRAPDIGCEGLRVLAVMGRRPGHIFHPSEGRGTGALLFGHGPVFRDLNAVLDLEAVEVVLRAGVELILLPYAAARDVLLDEADLQFIARLGPAGALVAERSRGWLAYWRRDIGLEGFYPFDLLAAAFLDDPSRLRCADVTAWVGRDRRLAWYPRERALLVSQGDPEPIDVRAQGRAVYCDAVTRRELRSLFAS
jgi:purine nucleosidase